MKCFLEAIREQKLPTDLLDVLDDAKVAYYDGTVFPHAHTVVSLRRLLRAEIEGTDTDSMQSHRRVSHRRSA